MAYQTVLDFVLVNVFIDKLSHKFLFLLSFDLTYTKSTNDKIQMYLKMNRTIICS